MQKKVNNKALPNNRPSSAISKPLPSNSALKPAKRPAESRETGEFESEASRQISKNIKQKN